MPIRPPRSPLSFLRRLVTAAFAGLLAGVALAAEPLRVVVTNSILDDLVRVVAAEDAAVTTLVPRGVDPHGFEPRPADAAAITRADLVFTNGLGFDAWADRLIEAAGARARTHVASAGITPLTCADIGHHDHHDGHDHEEHDPHAWQDPRLVVRYVENIRAALAAAAPARAEAFAARAAAYTAELEKLHAWAAAEFARVPAERRVFVTSHDALAYLGHAYGLRILTLRGVAADREPSARELARLIAYIREQKVPAVFVENTTNPRLPGLLARDAGVRLGEPLFTDSLGEPGDPAATYLELVRENVRRITAALAP